ncbi:MAG: hypothetical protein WCA35_30195, partial [Kovacikia sp.]
YNTGSIANTGNSVLVIKTDDWNPAVGKRNDAKDDPNTRKPDRIRQDWYAPLLIAGWSANPLPKS